ncbi:MAG: transcriptional activator RfaH [Candidatus Paracaedibacteraceae bacterium]|nr:transcriptional activator RfaH [Candidatus Paracaedibacteraceae bacterium]
MKQWFAVHTQPQKEWLASQELKRQGFEVYYPKFLKTRRHARRTDEIITPLFPRYIFVAFDLEETPWRCINGTRGVVHLLTNNNKPVCLPAQIIIGLKDRETPLGVVPLETLSLFTGGNKVRIVEGAFEGYNATIIAQSDQQRVQLLIEFMGRQLQLGIPVQMIEAA